MSNREPAPPVKERNSAPEAAVPVRAVETVVKVSQPPVGWTATEPSRAPVADPDRIWMVPPAPPEETFALKVLIPAVGTDAYPAQSPFSMKPSVLPP